MRSRRAKAGHRWPVYGRSPQGPVATSQWPCRPNRSAARCPDVEQSPPPPHTSPLLLAGRGPSGWFAAGLIPSALQAGHSSEDEGEGPHYTEAPAGRTVPPPREHHCLVGGVAAWGLGLTGAAEMGPSVASQPQAYRLWGGGSSVGPCPVTAVGSGWGLQVGKLSPLVSSHFTWQSRLQPLPDSQGLRGSQGSQQREVLQWVLKACWPPSQEPILGGPACRLLSPQRLSPLHPSQ